MDAKAGQQLHKFSGIADPAVKKSFHRSVGFFDWQVRFLWKGGKLSPKNHDLVGGFNLSEKYEFVTWDDIFFPLHMETYSHFNRIFPHTPAILGIPNHQTTQPRQLITGAGSPICSASSAWHVKLPDLSGTPYRVYAHVKAYIHINIKINVLHMYIYI